MYLFKSIPVLDYPPTELCDSKGCRKREFEVRASSLIIPTPQVLSSRTNTLVAGVRPPRQPLEQASNQCTGNLHQHQMFPALHRCQAPARDLALVCCADSKNSPSHQIDPVKSLENCSNWSEGQEKGIKRCSEQKLPTWYGNLPDRCW